MPTRRNFIKQTAIVAGLGAAAWPVGAHGGRRHRALTRAGPGRRQGAGVGVASGGLVGLGVGHGMGACSPKVSASA